MLYSFSAEVKVSHKTFLFVFSHFLEFQRNLEKDVVSETSGHFRRLLVSMLQAARDETNNVDWNKAKADAKVSIKENAKRRIAQYLKQLKSLAQTLDETCLQCYK